jgi:hypothetical protein
MRGIFTQGKGMTNITRKLATLAGVLVMATVLGC